MKETLEFGRRLLPWDISSAGLHIIAMATMLIDHAMKTVIPSDSWVFLLGRLAFPIFAFLAAEGYAHTHNLYKYIGRMALFALLSEVPYDLMKSGTMVEWYDQNVIWTFLIALIVMGLIDWVKQRAPKYLALPAAVLLSLAGIVAGMILCVDYGGLGVFTVLIFHFLRERTWINMVLQAVLLAVINLVLLGAMGFGITVSLGGAQLEIPMQGFAVFALIPIWLYRGRQGLHGKIFQYLCYGFYPVHMLVLDFLLGLL